MSYHKFKSIDIDAFKSDITMSVLCSDTGVTLAIYPSSTSPSEILDRHPPIKTKALATCVRIPWFNADVQQLNCIHCKAERNPLKEVFPQIGLHIRKSVINILLFSRLLELLITQI